MRRVERERPRRHFGHAHAAPGASEAPREQPIASIQGVDDDDVVSEAEGDLDRFGEATLDARLQDDAIDNDIDRVIAPPIQLDVLVERALLAVNPDLGETARAKRRQLFLELALPAANDWREHVHAFIVRRQHHHIDDAFERLRRDLAAA